ncbi:hypothetical protein CMI47_05390 [Candidatus Pacearchaeota archaeon]|nr:hypothetical protein [Candidatus Pacearchaeota archaeon]
MTARCPDGQDLAHREAAFFGFVVVEPADLGFEELAVGAATASPVVRLVSAATDAPDAVRVEGGLGDVLVELNRRHVLSLFSFGTVVNMPDRVRSICAKTPVPHRDKPLAQIYKFGAAA